MTTAAAAASNLLQKILTALKRHTVSPRAFKNTVNQIKFIKEEDADDSHLEAASRKHNANHMFVCFLKETNKKTALRRRRIPHHNMYMY